MVDPIKPKVFYMIENRYHEAWSLEKIRELPPQWWQRASDVYTEAFNTHGCYHSAKEINQRFRQANLYLLSIVKKHKNGIFLRKAK